MSAARAWGIAAGYLADRALGDPRRGHPVAGFGTAARRLEQALYRDARPRGALHTALLVGGVAAVGAAIETAAARRPVLHAATTAAATWVVLGGRTLEREGLAVHALLAADVVAARQRLTHLVSRDTAELDESEVARAVVESVAENTSDAIVAPLLWGAVAGVPGLVAYRAANTLDAMVGYRNRRYLRFGWAAARLDDLLNLPASRLTGCAVLAASPGTAPAAWRTWRRDAGSHPSPNAGVVEAAFAGALALRLGGRNAYPDAETAVVEHRAALGDGAAPGADDIVRSVALSRRVGAVCAAVLTGLLITGDAVRRSRS